MEKRTTLDLYKELDTPDKLVKYVNDNIKLYELPSVSKLEEVFNNYTDSKKNHRFSKIDIERAMDVNPDKDETEYTTNRTDEIIKKGVSDCHDTAIFCGQCLSYNGYKDVYLSRIRFINQCESSFPEKMQSVQRLTTYTDKDTGFVHAIIPYFPTKDKGFYTVNTIGFKTEEDLFIGYEKMLNKSITIILLYKIDNMEYRTVKLTRSLVRNI